jgi:hypothetical protein
MPFPAAPSAPIRAEMKPARNRPPPPAKVALADRSPSCGGDLRMRARRRQRRCQRRARPAQLCLSLLATSANMSDLFSALHVRARGRLPAVYLQRLVDRDRRLRAERAAFRSDMHLRKKLKGVEDGPLIDCVINCNVNVSLYCGENAALVLLHSTGSATEWTCARRLVKRLR